MPAAFARNTKITNAAGRADYITDKKRQEEIVMQRSSMRYDWAIHAKFEKDHQKFKTANNEAREVMFKLPNELYDDPEKLAAVCDAITQRIVGSPNRDYEYAVHWNHARTNLHCHLLFSERENIAEPLPKVYKRDIWYNYETQRIARAGSPGAELIHRKGEVQRDADGKIKYESDIFTPKDTRYVSRGFVHEIRQICREVMNEHGFEYENTTTDSPYLPQRKLYKGASEDYLAAARAYNDAVKEYNELIRDGLKVKPEQNMLDLTVLKSLTLDYVKRANHDARRITKKSVSEVLKSVHNVLTDMFAVRQPQMTVVVPDENIAGANGIYALRLREGFIFFQPHELCRVGNGVEITLEKDAIYSVTSEEGQRERYTGEELIDIIQADLEMPQQRQTQRQRQMDDDFEL